MRKLLIFKIIFVLAGCSALPPNVAGNFNQTFKAFSALIYGYEDYPINQALVDEIPYASLRMKIGKGPAGLLILETIAENRPCPIACACIRGSNKRSTRGRRIIGRRS